MSNGGLTYIPIRVNSISASEVLGFDLYQQNDSKYQLYRHHSIPLKQEDIEELREYGCEFLHVPESQQRALYRHMGNNLPMFLKDEAVPVDIKEQILTETAVVVLSDVLGRPPDASGLHAASEQGAQHVSFALSGARERDTLQCSQPTAAFPLAHAVTVGNLCILLGLRCGLDSHETLHALGVAGMLHELGKTILDQDYYNHPVRITATRMRRYPEVGRDLMRDLDAVPPGALRPVAEHQERLDGSGFPQGLKSLDIAPASRILSICDAFDEATNPQAAWNRATAFDALRLMRRKQDEFDQEILAEFIRMMGEIPCQEQATTPGRSAATGS